MKKIEVVKYVAEDGKEFDTEQECTAYENKMLKYRQLINCFEVFNEDLIKINKPKCLWRSDEEEINYEINKNSEFINFDFKEFCDDMFYIMFKKNENYDIISSCFSALGEYFGFDLDFPEEIGKSLIIYWSRENDEWRNYDEMIEKVENTLEIYESINF